MSKSDKHAQTTARDGRPVVLIVGDCFFDAQKYLDDNLVLKALYGDKAPLRMRAHWLPDELLEPECEEPEVRLALLTRFGRVPAVAMPDFIKSTEFHKAVFDCLISGLDLSPHQVQVIIGDIGYLAKGSPVIEVIRQYFPDAIVFSVDGKGSLPMPFDIGRDR